METKEEIQKKFKDLLGKPIDWANYKKLAKDCWLFLTNDKLPNKATIKKEAFLHEVASMIESAVLLNSKPLWGFFYNSCIHESSYAMMSLHRNKKAAEAAMSFHREKKEKQYNERYKDDEHFKKSCPFGQMESWIVDKVKVEK